MHPLLLLMQLLHVAITAPQEATTVDAVSTVVIVVTTVVTALHKH